MLLAWATRVVDVRPWLPASAGLWVPACEWSVELPDVVEVVEVVLSSG